MCPPLSLAQLKPISILGNQHCAFNAIATAMSVTLLEAARAPDGKCKDELLAAKETKLAADLRQKVAHILDDPNFEYHEQIGDRSTRGEARFGVSFRSKAKYIQQMEAEGWAGELELAILAKEIVRRPIVVYYDTVSFTYPSFNACNRYIYLHQTMQGQFSHFDLLITKPPPVFPDRTKKSKLKIISM